ncbi:MAG: hypothetical protein HYZ81_08140, partial [Nitrospinae bacterium]|nr:hypothetical protein [Nitrospinota bacterium]
MWHSTVLIILAFALSILVGPLAADAQRPAKVPRIGFLHEIGQRMSCSAPPFLRALDELGYVEG